MRPLGTTLGQLRSSRPTHAMRGLQRAFIQHVLAHAALRLRHYSTTRTAVHVDATKRAWAKGRLGYASGSSACSGSSGFWPLGRRFTTTSPTRAANSAARSEPWGVSESPDARDDPRSMRPAVTRAVTDIDTVGCRSPRESTSLVMVTGWESSRCRGREARGLRPWQRPTPHQRT